MIGQERKKHVNPHFHQLPKLTERNGRQLGGGNERENQDSSRGGSEETHMP